MTEHHPCPRYEPELSAFLDGETPAALRAEIETHLRACGPCRAAVGQLRAVSRTLRRWDAHETRYATSSGFRNRVLSKVGVEIESPRVNTLWRVAAAVALVAAGAGGFALIAPRLSSPSGADYALVAQELARLNRALLDRPAVAVEPAPGDVAVPRLGPFAPVVARAVDDGPASAPEVPEVVEERGDEHFLREALADHDDYVSERRTLALEEQVRRMQESRTVASAASTHADATPPSALATFLGEVRVSSSNVADYENVQVWPVELSSGRAPERPRTVACADAIAQDILGVTEGPSLETVVAVNSDGKRSVLVLAGDVLAGGLQDRVAREDVLVAPGESLSIPTYTSGRVRSNHYRKFTSSSGIAPPELRALVAADRALLAGGLGQADFDDAVGRTVRALATPGGRGSLDNLFQSQQLGSQADPFVKKFEKRLDGAAVIGFAFAAGSQILGVELFGDHATFMEHRSRVLRSYVMSAIAMDRRDGVLPSRDVIAKILDAAPKSAFHADAQSGSGTLSAFRGVGAAGADIGAFGFGLLDGTHVVHAMLFTTMPLGIDPSASRGGRRTPGDGSVPIDGGRGASNPGRGGNDGGSGVAPK